MANAIEDWINTFSSEGRETAQRARSSQLLDLISKQNTDEKGVLNFNSAAQDLLQAQLPEKDTAKALQIFQLQEQEQQKKQQFEQKANEIFLKEKDQLLKETDIRLKPLMKQMQAAESPDEREQVSKEIQQVWGDVEGRMTMLAAGRDPKLRKKLQEAYEGQKAEAEEKPLTEEQQRQSANIDKKVQEGEISPEQAARRKKQLSITTPTEKAQTANKRAPEVINSAQRSIDSVIKGDNFSLGGRNISKSIRNIFKALKDEANLSNEEANNVMNDRILQNFQNIPPEEIASIMAANIDVYSDKFEQLAATIKQLKTIQKERA